MREFWNLLLVAGGWVCCLIWFERCARLWLFSRAYPPLADDPRASGDPGTSRVCVIVPARDEAESIEACLRSLVAQDYPDLHVVAVNDRSADATGEIMDHLAAEYSSAGKSCRLTVLHVTDLPSGWLGKNHANHLAASRPVARDADFVLFTDGDVIFQADCLRRALALTAVLEIDFLSLGPDIVTHGVFERAMCNLFGFCYLLKCRPWKFNDPRDPDAFCGVGAFNLVRRAAYDAAGGHQPLRMEVLDDYKLGKLLKLSGARCALRIGTGSLRLRWQAGLRGVVRGLEKNAFAGADFRVAKSVYHAALVAVAFLAPILGSALVAGAARWGWVAAWISLVVGMAAVCRSPASGLLSPLCALAMAWAILRSTLLALVRGGVVWRDRLYPLAELKRGLV